MIGQVEKSPGASWRELAAAARPKRHPALDAVSVNEPYVTQVTRAKDARCGQLAHAAFGNGEASCRRADRHETRSGSRNSILKHSVNSIDEDTSGQAARANSCLLYTS